MLIFIYLFFIKTDQLNLSNSLGFNRSKFLFLTPCLQWKKITNEIMFGKKVKKVNMKNNNFT